MYKLIHMLFVAGLLVLVLANGVSSTNVNVTSAPESSTSSIKGTCDMLVTNRFHLDLYCVLGSKASLTAHELTAPSLDACERKCCQYREGPCDMVYWDRHHKCVLMNYYVLSICPLSSPSGPSSTSYNLLLRISNRVTSHIRKHLLMKGYRSQIRTLLGCSNDEFVCDDWTCVKNHFVCDGTPECSDGSDEIRCQTPGYKAKCIGYNNDLIDVGSEYTPLGERDGCKTCICGNNSLPSYCYSAACDPKPPSDCTGPQPDICCRCNDMDPPMHDDPDTDPSYFNLSSTQRLIVSCMSVLVIVTLLLFFSRSIVHRGRRGMLHNDGSYMPHGERHRPHSGTWFPSNPHGLPPNRSFFERYWANTDSVSFFDQDGLPAVYVDLPPPYNMLKSPTDPQLTSAADDAPSDAGLTPPPSYPPTNISDSRNSINRDNDNPTEESPIMHLSDDVTTSEPITSVQSEQEPTSPFSTSSECPLINDNDTQTQV